MVEIRPIPEWPEYGASRDGRIWSYRNQIWRVPRRGNFGYLRVNLSVDGKVKTLKVTRLVASAWLPNPHNFRVVNHKDSNPSNDHVDNLEWCTDLHNVLHCLYEGNGKIGQEHPRAKLTEADVVQIRTQYAAGVLQRELGRQYGIRQNSVSQIVLRRLWKHI